ncbi:MAG: hypothetical protein RLZ44_1895 [Pseudomonadota bacterium]|jgi:DNA-binding transcriptional MerR regulator
MAYSIGEVTARIGISADALRYYERIGLLPRVTRNAGRQRRYSDRDLGRLRFIQRAQAMDFSLAEIADLLMLRERPDDVRSEVRALTERKLAEIEERVAALNALRAELSELVGRCRASDSECPIIRRMDAD